MNQKMNTDHLPSNLVNFEAGFANVEVIEDPLTFEQAWNWIILKGKTSKY
jgi:hypothetical protein